MQQDRLKQSRFHTIQVVKSLLQYVMQYQQQKMLKTNKNKSTHAKCNTTNGY